MVFNKFSSSPKLTKISTQSFHNDERFTKFSQKEFLNHVGANEDQDATNVLKNIMASPILEPNSAVFLDEVPLERNKSKNRYDWALLDNNRYNKDNISLVIAFQPMATPNPSEGVGNSRPINLKLPSSAAIIELTRAYRTSCSLFRALQDFHYLSGIKMIETQPTPVNLVFGCQPTIINFSFPTLTLSIWITYKIQQLECSPEQIKILFTDETEMDAKKLFQDKKYEESMTHWKEFVGCESPVVICFHSSKDEMWSLFHSVSRAQLQVIL